MRLEFSVIFILLTVALASCSFVAYHSNKKIGKVVAFMIASFIPPVIGNLIIVSTSVKLIAHIGCYCYYIGMDVLMLSVLIYTLKYCGISQDNNKLVSCAYILLISDALQLLGNLIFGHAFETEVITVDDRAYYRLVPHIGQYFHRIIDYGILAAVIIIYIVKIIKTPKINSERYFVILFSIIAAAIWQTFYIFSRTPVDRSMIGFGVLGLLIFYFSLYYRPLKLLDRMLANLASEIPESIFFFEGGKTCIWANPPAMQLIGINDSEFDTAPTRLIDMFGEFDRTDDNWTAKRTIGTGEDTRYYVLEVHSVKDEKQRIAGSFLSVRDETKEILNMRREMYNATHDTLTGLYTREYFYERISILLNSYHDSDYIILFFDVKNFKMVNDVFSKKFGDHVLKKIADWIRDVTSERAIYGRLGGDTFGVFMPEKEFDPQKIEDELSSFIVADDNIEYRILIHIGVYNILDSDTDVTVMFDRAHLALSSIKDDYKIHIAYYNNELRDKLLYNQTITAQLNDALKEKQIRPYLQPIVDGNGKVVGAEALARWIHPVNGFMSPGLFIPIFEKNGLIVEIDRHMWRCACELLAKWKDKRSDLFISVNISPKDFYFIDVVKEIKDLVKEFDISPSVLRIEITETVMMDDAEDRMSILNELRESGFIVEMDDFGSGYSSLNLLKDMPVDVLKIDMKFLSKAKDEKKSQKIMQNIMNLSKDLDISSLTEGVETESQFKMLSDMNCCLFQGYFFAKPMPVEDFEKFIFND